MKTILETKAVTKVYRAGKVDVLALRGIDLRAHQGEFVAIMGPSGCGSPPFFISSEA